MLNIPDDDCIITKVKNMEDQYCIGGMSVLNHIVLLLSLLMNHLPGMCTCMLSLSLCFPAAIRVSRMWIVLLM